MAPDGRRVLVQHLKRESVVLAAGGRELRVAYHREHPEPECDLVWLRAGSATLTITASHRVAIWRQEGEQQHVPAKDLCANDIVCCSGGMHELESIYRFSQATVVYEVEFDPDEDLETFLPPTEMILTRGAVGCHFGRRRIRR